MIKILAYNNCNIYDLILQSVEGKPRKIGNKVLINPCPICGRKDHFFIYPDTQSYFSFANCCKGGSVIDWLMEYEGLTLSDAMSRINGNKIIDNRKIKETKRIAELLNEKLEAFFDLIVEKFKIFQYGVKSCENLDIENTNYLYRYLRQGMNYYDALSEKFISGDVETRLNLMKNYTNDYFHKLNPKAGEAIGI